MRINKKAVSELMGGVIFIAISLAAIIIVLGISNPRINEMKDNIAIDQAKDTLASVDRVIRDVASEGKGSTRRLPIQIKAGRLGVDEENDRIYYYIDTNANIISPRSKRRIGNLWFSSNTNVSVYNDSTHYYLENSHMLINISKYGTASNHTPMNPDYLIDSIAFKDKNQIITDNVTIHIDGSALSGVGYNYAKELGTNLPRGRIINFFNTTTANYTVQITLESGSDYFQIEVIDIVDK